MGELTFLKSLNSTFEIQARTEPAGSGPGAPAVTTGIVVNQPKENIPVVQVSMAKSSDSEQALVINNCPVQVFLDGEAVDFSGNKGSKFSGGSVKVKKQTILLHYPSENLRLRMKVKFYRRCLFSVDYIIKDCNERTDSLVGILGSPNGIGADEWMDRKGNALEIPKMGRGRYFKPSYDYVTENWCITDGSESYFTHKGYKTFDDINQCESG
jgi:hypothetical protein